MSGRFWLRRPPATASTPERPPSNRTPYRTCPQRRKTGGWASSDVADEAADLLLPADLLPPARVAGPGSPAAPRLPQLRDSPQVVAADADASTSSGRAAPLCAAANAPITRGAASTEPADRGRSVRRRRTNRHRRAAPHLPGITGRGAPWGERPALTSGPRRAPPDEQLAPSVISSNGTPRGSRQFMRRRAHRPGSPPRADDHATPPPSPNSAGSAGSRPHTSGRPSGCGLESNWTLITPRSRGNDSLPHRR